MSADATASKPPKNIEAIVERKVDGQLVKMIVARHCEGCGSTHDGTLLDTGGARYLRGERWLCVVCMCNDLVIDITIKL